MTVLQPQSLEKKEHAHKSLWAHTPTSGNLLQTLRALLPQPIVIDPAPSTVNQPTAPNVPQVSPQWSPAAGQVIKNQNLS